MADLHFYSFLPACTESWTCRDRRRWTRTNFRNSRCVCIALARKHCACEYSWWSYSSLNPLFLTPPPRSVEARHPLESHYSRASACAVCICARGGGRVASDRRRQLRPLPDAGESGAGVGALVPLGHSAPLPASGNTCRDLPLTSIESLSLIRFRLAAHLFFSVPKAVKPDLGNDSKLLSASHRAPVELKGDQVHAPIVGQSRQGVSGQALHGKGGEAGV